LFYYEKLILAFAFFCATSVVFANTPLKEDSSKKEEKTQVTQSAEKPKEQLRIKNYELRL